MPTYVFSFKILCDVAFGAGMSTAKKLNCLKKRKHSHMLPHIRSHSAPYGNVLSVAVLAEILLRSTQKLVICSINNYIYSIKVSKKHMI